MPNILPHHPTHPFRGVDPFRGAAIMKLLSLDPACRDNKFMINEVGER
ncbi:hypothetical protein O7598_07970 [Micromonospora sp. WMMC241]|nr:hypothetical protein [Micromonospora sp. WMMC241]MCZ7436325.1 hypothetical protein [Micromonospora sp. WMMC241]